MLPLPFPCDCTPACIDSALTKAPSVKDGKDATLSQTVTGELVGSVTCEEWFVKCLAFSADRPDHLILFRKYVSRQAAKKGRAVLEGVGLHTETIDACFSGHLLDEEGAVQEGQSKWSSGQIYKPPTWEVLFSAMEYAKIAQQHIDDLRKELHT